MKTPAESTTEFAWLAELRTTVEDATRTGEMVPPVQMVGIIRRHQPELAEREAARLGVLALEGFAELNNQKADALENYLRRRGGQ